MDRVVSSYPHKEQGKTISSFHLDRYRWTANPFREKMIKEKVAHTTQHKKLHHLFVKFLLLSFKVHLKKHLKNVTYVEMHWDEIRFPTTKKSPSRFTLERYKRIFLFTPSKVLSTENCNKVELLPLKKHVLKFLREIHLLLRTNMCHVVREKAFFQNI